MPSIFSKIIAGAIPSYKVAENDSCIAFLDINPLKPGHTLVVPKLEVDELFDLPEENYLNLQLFAKQVAEVLKKNIRCKRIAVVVLGFEVPHAHIHLIPIDSEEEIDFKRKRLSFNKEELMKLASSLNQSFSQNISLQ